MAKVFFISKNNVRDAWLSAVGQVLYNGDDIKTEYDNPEDPPSKDATVLVEVKEPLSTPIMRKDKVLKIKSKYDNAYEIYGSMADTYLIGSIQSGYIEEILEGKNDNLLYDSGVSFPYSYHDRIYNYSPYSLEDSSNNNSRYNILYVKSSDVMKQQKLIRAGNYSPNSTVWKVFDGKEIKLSEKKSGRIEDDSIPLEVLELPRVNQIEYIINKLKESPHSRRAQAITWRPLVDPNHDDPPCLQRIFMRIKDKRLMMHTTWRSRDLFRAWEANVNGMIRIQKLVADRLGVEMGHYLDFSNSLHIYGNTISEVKDMLQRMKTKGEQFPEEIRDLIE
ncbi:MAG: thymidylate synthase [Promethearchaeota archaeon]|jgi:thymidylate synthase (methanogen type)